MYEKTKQNSLVAKFDGIVINDAATEKETKLNIAGDDVKHCEAVQKEFDVIMENLRDFKALCEAIEKEADQSGRYPVFEKMSKSLLYFPGADFEEKEKESKQAFINAIFRYFSDKYYLKEFDLSALCDDETLDYKMVVDKILSEFGELNIYGVSRIKDDFKKKFCTIHASCPGEVPIVKNNKITIPHMFWYETSWDGSKSIGYQYEGDVNLLKRALSFFETGVNELIDFNLPISGYANKLQFAEPYETGLNKITAVKFFKNRRVDLIFKSAEYAGEFFEMFGLSNPIDNRRK